MLRSLIKPTDPRLFQNAVAIKLEAITEYLTGAGELHEFITEMVDIIQLKHMGIGLSASQLGVLQRVIVTKLEDEATVFINPVLISFNHNTVTSYEGCTSLPGIFGYVQRPIECTIEFVNKDGLQQTGVFTGMESTVMLHEFDHLNGILFPSRGFNRTQRRYIQKQLGISIPVMDELDYKLN